MIHKDCINVSMIFLGSERAASGLRDLETQVASCGNVSDSENICTYTMDLQSVKLSFPIHQCF